MALSNWDTLALDFSATERRWDEATDGPEPVAARAARAELDALVADFKRQTSDVQELMDLMSSTPRFHELSRAESEALTIREIKVTPSHGTFQTDSGWSVEIYKNWLYLGSADRWREGESYVSPIMMEIQDGSMRVGGMDLWAIRGPQEGVWMAATVTSYEKDAFGRQVTNTRGMVGCGVYGYDDMDWVGVRPESLAWFHDELRKTESVLGAIDLSEGQRFNQGDRFFAEHFDKSTPTTAPGEVETPIFNQLLGENDPNT